MGNVIRRGCIYTKYGAISKYGEKIEIPKNCIAIPGFIDIHTHGGYNIDTMDGSLDGLKKWSYEILKEGTTSFYPTTVTESTDNIIKALRNIEEYIKKNNTIGAEVLGVHLEGPFLNEKFNGAQDIKYLKNPSIGQFKNFEENSDDIKIVTYAIENDKDLMFTKYLKQKGIISSIGHSNANFKEIEKALSIRDLNITHFYNACSGYHHRTPGIVNAGLYFDNIMIELIADGIHVDRSVIRETVKLKGVNKIILITDSMRAKGLDDGVYKLGPLDVIKKGNSARLKNGNLGGSILSMNEAFKNIIEYTNCSLEEAVLMTSTNASIRMKINNKKGSLDLGKDADIVILDENLNVLKTYCKGILCYEK